MPTFCVDSRRTNKLHVRQLQLSECAGSYLAVGLCSHGAGCVENTRQDHRHRRDAFHFQRTTFQVRINTVLYMYTASCTSVCASLPIFQRCFIWCIQPHYTSSPSVRPSVRSSVCSSISYWQHWVKPYLR